jgi:integrase
MALYKRGGVWWMSFVFAGKRIQESTKMTKKSMAVKQEEKRKTELERAYAGLPAEWNHRKIRSVQDVVTPYLEHYGINHRPKSALFTTGRLAHVSRLLGSVLISDLTEDRIRGYIKIRLGEGVSGRTINMELGELSRAIGQPWSLLWPKIRKLEERKDVGRALSTEEQGKLLTALAECQSPLLPAIVRIALLTGMRSGEILSLTWGQVDNLNRILTVGRAKTSCGTGRTIPINGQLAGVFASHRIWFTTEFGEARSEHHLFPSGAPLPLDPSKPVLEVKRAWGTLRRKSEVQCRMHDLRHTVATRMAEAGVPEATMLSLLGHMSRAMLERYSHIRMAAKRTAVENLTLEISPISGVVVTKVSTVAKPAVVQ